MMFPLKLILSILGLVFILLASGAIIFLGNLGLLLNCLVLIVAVIVILALTSIFWNSHP
jgi:hypothetical protein